MSVKWQEPAPVMTAPTSNPKRDEDIEKLKTQPGRWAVLSTHATFLAARTIKARLKRRFGDDFEFSTRTDKDTGQGLVYGRYVGQPK